MGARGIYGYKRHWVRSMAAAVLAAAVTFGSILGAAATANVYAASSGNTAGIVYIVEKGDSLEKIAKEFSVTVEQLKKINNLRDDDFIQVGQELKIGTAAQSVQEVPERLRSDDVVSRGSDTASTNTSSSNTTSAVSDPNGGTISLNMVDTDIRDILSTIAMSMGTSIVYLGDAMKVSFKVDGVTPMKALELLVQGVNSPGGTMGYLKDGNLIIVGVQTKLQKDFFNKMALTRFRVNYISPDILSAQLDKLGIPVQKITLDKSSKYIWVQGLPQALTKTAEVIAALDRPENFDTDTSQLKATFSLAPYTLEYITADKLNDLIGKLGLKVKTLTVDTNPKVLWATGTAQNLKDLEQLISKVDVPESAGETFSMEAVRLTFLTYAKLLPLVTQLDLPVQILRVGDGQRAIWLKGSVKDVADVKDLIRKLDVKDNGEQYQYFVYTLQFVSPVDEVEKIKFLNIDGVSAMALNYGKFSHEIFVKCPQDMQSTILDILNNTDVSGKKINVPVDSATGSSAYNSLNNRKQLIYRILGIPLENMYVSDNITKTDTPYYILWVRETPDNIRLIRNMVQQIDSPQ